MSNEKVKILSFGEIIWDVYPDAKFLGGAPLNFVAHVVKSGGAGWLLSAVGRDELGMNSLERLRELDVNCDYVSFSDKSTGRCMVTLDENGVPSYDVLENVAFDEIRIDDKVLNKDFDALAFGTLSLRSENNLNALKRLLLNEKIRKVFCDLNLRYPFYNVDVISFCLKTANILKVSEAELKYISENFLCKNTASYQESAIGIFTSYKNLELIVVTCGENGSYAYESDGYTEYRQAAKKVEVVSTVGAGDSFGAAFLVSYLEGESIQKCLKKATDRSAYVISRFGSLPE